MNFSSSSAGRRGDRKIKFMRLLGERPKYINQRSTYRSRLSSKPHMSAIFLSDFTFWRFFSNEMAF